MQPNTPIIQFYLGQLPDNRGRTIEHIWKQNHQWLEATHDYIQWLFPLTEKSRFNPHAPILIETDIRSFNASEELKNRLACSFNLMLNFYGLSAKKSEDDIVIIILSETFAERKKVWVHWGNHNHYRITRILKSLRSLGLRDTAETFFNCLEQIYLQEKGEVTNLTYSLWKEAINLNDQIVN